MARVGNRRMANWKSTGLTRHLPLKRSWNLFAAAAKDRAKHDAVLVSAMAFPARRHEVEAVKLHGTPLSDYKRNIVSEF